MKEIYVIKDNKNDPKARHCENFMGITYTHLIPQKAVNFIDKQKPYYHTYYFSNKQECEEFFNQLWEEK